MFSLLALVAAIVYGGADFLGGLATRRSAIMPVAVFSQLAGFVTFFVAQPLVGGHAPSAADLAWGGASGLAGGLGLMFLYRGLAEGRMSIVAPVTAVLAVVVPVLVGTMLGERHSALAAAGVILALAAIVLVSQEASSAGSGAGLDRGLGSALLAGVLIGFFYVGFARTAPGSGLWPLASARVVSVLGLTALATARGQSLRPARTALPLIVAGGMLDMLANTLYLLAMRGGSLGIAATLTSLYPASTIVLARIVLGERLRGLQIAGLACAGVAIALVTLY